MIDIIPPKINSKRPNKKIVEISKYFFLVLVVAVAIYFGFKLINIRLNSWLKLEPINLNKVEGSTSKTTKDSQSVNNRPKVSNDDQSTETKKTTLRQTLPETNFVKNQATEAPTSAVAPAVNKTAISIKVLNGNGVPGAARKVKNILEQAGFKVSATGNAQSRYNSTVIYFQTNKKTEAELIQKTLTNNYQVSIEENNAVASSTNLLVVVGGK